MFSAQVAGAGLSFVFSVLLARLIGASGVGLYFIATTIIDIGAAISRLGLENAVLRFSAVANHAGDRPKLAALYRKSLALVFGTAIALAFPAWLILSRLPLGGDKAADMRAVLPWVVLAFGPIAVRAIQAEFFKGIGAPRTGTFVHSVLPPLLLLLGGLVLWWLAAVSFQEVVFTYFVVALASALYALAAWYRRQPGIWRERGGHFDTSLLLHTGLPLLFVTFGNLAMNWTDILVLGVYSDPNDVGVYGVARRITILTTTFVMASVASVTAPRFAALHAQGDRLAMARLARQSTVWMLVATTPLILLLLVFPEVVLRVFGSHFEQGAWPLRILALGQLVVIGVGPVEYLLIMTGREKLMRNIIGIFATINVAGNLALVPSYGAVGAAISTAFCLAAMDVVCLLMVRKHLYFTTWTMPAPAKR